MTKLYIAKLRHYLHMLISALADTLWSVAKAVSDAACSLFWKAADAEQAAHTAKYVAAEDVVRRELYRAWVRRQGAEIRASEARVAYDSAVKAQTQRILDLAR